jgi:hypothetical protein
MGHPFVHFRFEQKPSAKGKRSSVEDVYDQEALQDFLHGDDKVQFKIACFYDPIFAITMWRFGDINVEQTTKNLLKFLEGSGFLEDFAPLTVETKDQNGEETAVDLRTGKSIEKGEELPGLMANEGR